MAQVIVDHLQSLEEYNAWCGISPRYGGLLSRRLPGEDPPDRLEPDAFLERVEDDADLTRIRRQAEREATGRSVAKGATRVGPDRKSKRKAPRFTMNGDLVDERYAAAPRSRRERRRDWQFSGDASETVDVDVIGGDALLAACMQSLAEGALEPDFEECVNRRNGHCPLCGEDFPGSDLIGRRGICDGCVDRVWRVKAYGCLVRFCKTCKRFRSLGLFRGAPTALKCGVCRAVEHDRRRKKKGGGGQPDVYEHEMTTPSKGRLRLRVARAPGQAGRLGEYYVRWDPKPHGLKPPPSRRLPQPLPAPPPQRRRAPRRRSPPPPPPTPSYPPPGDPRHELFRRALDAPPADSAKVSEARDWLAAAIAHDYAGRVDDAVVAYLCAIKADRDLGAAFQFLGNLELKRGRTREALLCFEEELRILPDHARRFQPHAGVPQIHDLLQRHGALPAPRAAPPPPAYRRAAPPAARRPPRSAAPAGWCAPPPVPGALPRPIPGPFRGAPTGLMAMPPPLAVEDASGEVRARQEAAAHLSGEAPVQARPLTSLAIKPVPTKPPPPPPTDPQEPRFYKGAALPMPNPGAGEDGERAAAPTLKFVDPPQTTFTNPYKPQKPPPPRPKDFSRAGLPTAAPPAPPPVAAAPPPPPPPPPARVPTRWDALGAARCRTALPEQLYYARPAPGPPASLNPTLFATSPPPVPAPVPAQASAENPVFLPAGAFYGSIPGYVFKVGPWGLGYYLDLPPAPSTAVLAQQMAQTPAPAPAVPPTVSAAAPAPQVAADAAALPPALLKPPPPRTKGLKAPDAAPQAPEPPPQVVPAPASTAVSPAPAAPASTRPSRWTPEEEEKLRSLVAELGDNWSLIAERLGTGRSVGALETKWSKLEASALRALVPDAFPAPAPAPVVRGKDEPDAEVMPTRRKRGYVTLSDRAPRPSTPLNESSSDDEVMPTKRPRGPPKRRGN